MGGLDTMGEKPTKRRKHLLSDADPNDRLTFEKMDQLLKEYGVKYSIAVDELQLPAQGMEPSQEERLST